MATNPYLQAQQDAISSQVNNSLFQTQLPGINRSSVANGGYGGSRQGIAQGLAMNGANQSIANATANLQGQAYENDQNRANQMSIAQMNDATQRYGLSNQYDLGLKNNQLGYFNGQNSYNLGLGGLANQANAQDQNFYTNQRGQDLQQQQQGYNQYLGALTTQLGLGQQEYGIGQQQQQAPQTAIGNYANTLSPFTGLNQSSTNTTPSTGGGLGGALGGGLTVAQLLQLLNGGG